MKIGNLDISSFKIGGADCSIYLGSVKMYPTEEPTPPAPMNVITYEASEKLTETTTSSSGSLHTNKFSGSSGQQLTITSHTFENGVGTIEFNGDIASIGVRAFRGCSSLSSVTIPNSVTSIGSWVFEGCSSLTSIDIPSGVTSIGGSAFASCSSLTSVTIPDSVTSIGGSAFASCSSLTSVTIPDSVTSIGGNAFVGCKGLSSIVVDNGNTVYDSRNNCNAIIETLTNKLVVGCNNTTIPNSVTSIGNQAFNSCTSLTTIDIPNSVTSIGGSALRDCYSLTSVTIGNSVTSIGNQAFNSCTSLTSVTIPNSVTSVGKRAFYNCTGLTSVTVNATTPPTLGSDAFDNTNNCPIYVPNASVDAYKADWSDYTSRIEPMNQEYEGFCKETLSDGTVYELEGSGELTEAMISPDVYTIVKAEIGTLCTSIGNRAFYECSALESVTIPSSVTSIGDNAFNGCSNLTSIDIPNSVTSIGIQAFLQCNKLTSVNIPNTITNISEGVFDACRSLTSIDIPNSVTSISTRAFYECRGLTSIDIPNSVTSIGNQAFYSCSNLTSVTVNATTPPTMSYNNAFDDTNNCPIYVPSASVDAYKSATNWSTYASRIQAIPA